MSNEEALSELRDRVQAVSDETDADLILYSGSIFPPGDKELISLVRKFRRKTNVVLYLTTTGGLPDCAYRIARCLQRAYEGKFILFVDTICKSAGTLIALGADEIVMTVTGELGPLDVQLSKPDALAEQTSGLTPTQAIITLRDRAFDSLEEFFLALRFKSGLQITTRTALEVATKLSTGLFCPIFEQIDPMRLGEISRAMLIAAEYGKRLASGNEEEDTLRRLIEDYPSHGFVIDREEVAELFTKVRAPTDNEEQLAILTEPFARMGQDADEPIVEFLSLLVQVEENTSEATDGDENDNTGGDEGGEGCDGETHSGGSTATQEENHPVEDEGEDSATQNQEPAPGDPGG